jgi:hypothetical protein
VPITISIKALFFLDRDVRQRHQRVLPSLASAADD